MTASASRLILPLRAGPGPNNCRRDRDRNAGRHRLCPRAMGVAARQGRLGGSQPDRSAHGAANRRALMEASQAPTSHTMVLVIADVDRFKAVNHTYGHRAGDAVLQTVGRIMTQDLAGYGLEDDWRGGVRSDFVERLTRADHPRTSRPVARIETTPFVTPGGAFGITMSAGVAIRDPSEPFDTTALPAVYESYSWNSTPSRRPTGP